MKTRRNLISLGAGLLMGFGLLCSGMTDPAKVLAFLDVAGHWDPSLAAVMVAAVAVALGPFQWARRHDRAWSGDPRSLPRSRQIDAPLVVGSAIFGMGWGLAGYCPGPAIVGAAEGSVTAVWFVLAMAAGMFLERICSRTLNSRPSAP